MNFMTKYKIKELLLGVYSGWKNVDDVVNEIHASFQSITLPPALESEDEEEEEEEEWTCRSCKEVEGACMCEERI
jgi:hypothetical protein